jgi:hypothetical protein
MCILHVAADSISIPIVGLTAMPFESKAVDGVDMRFDMKAMGLFAQQVAAFVCASTVRYGT